MEFSPVPSGGVVYAGSLAYYVYALDARTGIVRRRTGNGARPDPAGPGRSRRLAVA
jgi:outer membrane protein assembly factor BamB